MGPARLLVLLLTGVLAVLPSPAMAAAKPHVTAAVTPSTAHVGSVVLLSGTVTPHAAGGVTVQRLVGRTWRTVGHTTSATTGRYTVSLRAPRTGITWQLRAVHGAARSVTVRVHVVTKIFSVRAAGALTTAATSPVTVIGKVSSKAAGTVALQAFQHRKWSTLTSAKLHTTSFTLTRLLVPGAYELRVVTGFTKTVAAGVSKPFLVEVTPPTSPVQLPAITTTTLPYSTVGIAYSTTFAAALGVPPYTWTVTGLPVGLSLSSQGALTGTAAAAGVSALTATVTDSVGKTATASLSLTVAHGLAHAWGSNMDDKLGDGTSNNSAVPVAVKTITDVIGVAGATDAGYALTADRTVWAWGHNASGQLGDGTTVAHSTPAQVKNLIGVTALAAGATTGYALKADGTVWAWGNGGGGELGNNTNVSVSVPVQVVNIPDATAVAAGDGTGYALRRDGTVWAWGSNDDGALGDGGAEAGSKVPVKVAGLSGVVAIAAGNFHAYALLGNGTLMAWGYDNSGELGDNGTVARGTPGPVLGLTGVATIASGSETGYALKTDGTVWAWGYGLEGELGNGGTSNSAQPVQVTGASGVVSVAGIGTNGFAVTADGSAYGWGFNGDGEAGIGSSATSVLTPSRIAGLTHVVSIGAGPPSTCAYAITAG